MPAQLATPPASGARAPHEARHAQGATCLARACPGSALIAGHPAKRQAVPSSRCQAQADSTVQALVREVEKRKLRPLPTNTENVADDASLHNPLQRHQRLSTGWMGVRPRLLKAVADTPGLGAPAAWQEQAAAAGCPRESAPASSSAAVSSSARCPSALLARRWSWNTRASWSRRPRTTITRPGAS